MIEGASELRELFQGTMGDTEVFIGTERMLEEDYKIPYKLVSVL